MSTIRIDIDGQARGQCLFFNVSDITIDRRLPGALNSHMSASVWTQFCDKIDEALTSIGEILAASMAHLSSRSTQLDGAGFFRIT